MTLEVSYIIADQVRQMTEAENTGSHDEHNRSSNETEASNAILESLVDVVEVVGTVVGGVLSSLVN